jgi:lauroyl/myristoyl acyltransferase
MSDQTYLKRAQGIAESIKQEIALLSRVEAMKSPLHNIYHLADANLQHFFPTLDAAQRRNMIAEVFWQQNMAVSDYARHDLIEETHVSDLAGVFESGGGARIYCLYHVGSYRHFFHFLARANIDCALFIAEKTLELQGQGIRDGANPAWPGRLDMINAEAGNSLLRGARALKRGQSVAIYIDGNTGSGANWESDRMQAVDFFDKTLLARTGIAYLSHLSGVPIVPVICKRGMTDPLSLTLHPPIAPGGIDRNEYVSNTTRALYALLEREITASPAQWEGWLYVHRYLKSRPQMAERALRSGAALQVNTILKANFDEFAVLDFGGKPALLDKKRHSFTILDERTAEVFRRAVEFGCVHEEGDMQPAIQNLFGLGALLTEEESVAGHCAVEQGAALTETAPA